MGRKSPIKRRGSRGICKKVPLSLEQAKEVVKLARWDREFAQRNELTAERRETRWYFCYQCHAHHTTSKPDRYRTKREAVKNNEAA